MTTPISRKLATILWVRDIQTRLGGLSLGAIEKWFLKKEFASNSVFWENYSKRFYQYLNGVKTPSQQYIDEIDKALPGTRTIFSHPLWQILDKPQADLEEINEWMLELEPRVYNRLFKESKRHGISKRRAIGGCVCIGNIGRISTLGALAALLMLMREAELNKQYEMYIDTKWEVQNILCRMATFQPIHEVAELLNDLVDRRFIARNNPLPASLKIPGTDEYPVCYIGPRRKPGILAEACINTHVLLCSIISGLVKMEQKAQLDYLFLLQQFTKRDALIDSLILDLSNHTEDACAKSPITLEKIRRARSVCSRRYSQ